MIRQPLRALPLLLMVMLVSMPLLLLLSQWYQLDTDLWRHLWSTQLWQLIQNTLVLLIGVVSLSTILGVSTAWCMAMCDFPGRRFFEWALVLPLAIPPYVLAFVFLGFFDFGGIFSLWLSYMGWQQVDARSSGFLIVVMSFVLYPYVYLLMRAKFAYQARPLLEQARLLGVSPLLAFFRVILPASSPTLLAACCLVAMETLADFGAVSIFNYDTFTTAIYKTWISFFSIETAAQLATFLLGFAVLILLLANMVKAPDNEQKLRRLNERYVLKAGYKWLVLSYCAVLLSISVLLPLTQLIIWVYVEFDGLFNQAFWAPVSSTLLLACLAAIVTLLMALSIAIYTQFYSQYRLGWLVQFCGLGYALPGSVLAVAIMLALGGVDRLIAYVWNSSSLLIGSIAGLLIAYLVRFFRPAMSAAGTGFTRIRSSMHESAQLLGVKRLHIWTRLYLPLLSPAILTGGLLVFVDVLKEMPATLILRPFGWDTLAVKIYELTSEGQWQMAAAPALLLVVVSLIPVYLLIRSSRITE